MLTKLTKRYIRIVFTWILVLSTIYTPQDAHAIYEGVRGGISYYSDGTKGYGHYGVKCGGSGPFNPDNCNAYRCNTGTLPFDPVGPNDDMEWKFDNPTCIGFMAGVGAAIVVADVAAGPWTGCKALNLAGAGKNVAEAATDGSPPPAVPYINPGILTRLARKSSYCASRWSEYTGYQVPCATIVPVDPTTTAAKTAACTQAGIASSDAVRCCSFVAAYVATYLAAIAALAIIWDVARVTYENARVCGHDWQQWIAVDGVQKKTKGPYRQCIEALFLKDSVPSNCSEYYGYTIDDNGRSVEVNMLNSNAKKLNIRNRFYREFIYGGKEFRDLGEGACRVPSTWGDDKRKEILGYTSNEHRYYMTGPGSASVYACQRFLSTDRNDAQAIQAFECCKKRSQNSICIENRVGLGGSLQSYNNAFCSLESRCSAGNVTFEAFESRIASNYICAKTYSVCPYDHLLGGGTEEIQYSTVDRQTIVNYCQVNNHCVKRPILPYIRTSGLDGGYISSACRDLKGDSQNSYAYEIETLQIKVDKFSSPMAQCFKETMENIFLHKAGDTKCTNPDEAPNKDGECVSGYVYKKGENLPGKSFFVKIQDKLQDIVRLVLSLSIMFLGFVILRGTPNPMINKKMLLTYILKIGLVMYFAVGDAWQGWFMKGLVDSSVFLSELTFRVDESAANNKLDGCQFPRYNYADSDPETKFNNPQYPPGKGYLRIWDTLDCKIARALGFGPEVSVPNLVLMIVAGFFTGGAGLIFVVGAFFFAFFLIALTVRALHVFLLSITSIVILLYVSPVIMPLVLFERTKNIFMGWMKNLLGFALQPLILFAYIGIMVTIFDSIVIGEDVTFSSGSDDPYGRLAPKRINCNSKADSTSIYCIFKVADIKTYSGFEAFGIGIPFLADLTQAKIDTVIKAAFIMFIFSKFMDQIAAFASKLVGGEALSSDWNISAVGMASKSFKTLQAIQQRGMRGMKKHGMKVARGVRDTAKAIGDVSTDRGKNISAVKTTRGGSHTESTAGSGTSKVVSNSAGNSGPNPKPSGSSGPGRSTTPPRGTS